MSFNNVTVGTQIGQGELSCITSWNVKNPTVLYVMYGSPTDNNATLFAQGYNAVLKAAGFNATATTRRATRRRFYESVGTWTPDGI